MTLGHFFSCALCEHIIRQAPAEVGFSREQQQPKALGVISYHAPHGVVWVCKRVACGVASLETCVRASARAVFAQQSTINKRNVFDSFCT